jgi:hypothetical protein
MVQGACPECDSDVPLEDGFSVGQQVICSECDTTLVLIGLTPPELDWVFEADNYGSSNHPRNKRTGIDTRTLH